MENVWKWGENRDYNKVCVDPPRIRALTLPASSCALAPAADMDRKAAAVDETDTQTDGRTDGHPTVT